MDLEENAIWVGIYVGESDSFGNIPAYKAVVHYLREHGSWGATVTWGVQGFGKQSKIQTASPIRLSEDPSIIIEVVDQKEKIFPLIPKLGEMIKERLDYDRGSQSAETHWLITVQFIRIPCIRFRFRKRTIF